MEIDVKIIITAIKHLPSFSKCEKEELVFMHQSVNVKKCRTLTFRKNHKTCRWDLII